MSKIYLLTSCFCLLFLPISGFAQVVATPSAAPTPLAIDPNGTATPTATPAGTPTPTPTTDPFVFATATPTSTPAPIPTLIKDPAVLQNQVTAKDLAPFMHDLNASLRKNVKDGITEALDAISNNLDYQPHPEAYWITKSALQFIDNKCDDAKESALQGKTLHGSDSDLAYLLGLSYACLQDAKSSERYFEEALWYDNLRAFPKPDVYLASAKILDYLSERDKASDALDALLTITHGTDEARLLRMKFAVEAGDRNRALELARTLPKSDFKDFYEAKALIINADMLLMSDDIKRAQSLSTALCDKPKFDQVQEACITEINSYLDLGKAKEASAIADKYILLYPDNSQFTHLKSQAELEATASHETDTFEGLPLQ